MMRNHYTALISAVLGMVLFITDSNATSINPADTGPCENMSTLIAFVAQRTEYTPTQYCPRVQRVAASKLRSLAAGLIKSHAGEPMAIFLPSAGEIVLSHEIDLSNPLGRSYLVHELVHAQQIANGVHSSAPCLGWMEGEAYRIQAEYLRSEGATEDALGIEILGLLQGACASAYHPELIAN